MTPSTTNSIAARVCGSLAGLALLLANPGALANDPPPSRGEFQLRRSSIDAGGSESIGGKFYLHGTTGQHDIVTMNGGDFTLKSGFWTPSGVPELLFRDGFEA